MYYASFDLLASSAKFALSATLLVALATAAAELAPLDDWRTSASASAKLPCSIHNLALRKDGCYVALRFPQQIAVGEAWDLTPPTVMPCPDGIPEALAGPTPDGRVLVGFGDGWLCSWAPDGSSSRWRTVGRHTGPVERLAVSLDGGLASAAHVAPKPAAATTWTVTIWDLAAGEVAAKIAANGPVDGLSFCGNSERLITRAGDGTLSVWQARGGEHLATVGCGPPGCGSLACSPFGSFVATCIVAGNDSRRVFVSVSDLSDRTPRWETTIDLGNDAAAFHRPRLAYSPDGELLACGTADAVTLFNARDGRVLAEANAGWHRVSALQFAADGRCVVSAGQDGTVRWWSLPGLSELQRVDNFLSD